MVDLLPCPRGINLALLDDPLLQRNEERRYHVEFVGIVRVFGRVVVVVLVPLLPEGRQIGQLVPLDLANLLPGAGLEVGVNGDIAENVEPNLLVAHSDLNELGVLAGRDETRGADVEPGLLVHLADRAVQVVLVLVDLSPGEAPVRALLPTPHQKHRVHGLIQQDSPTHGDACLVLQELLERLYVDADGEGGQEGAVLEYPQAEGPQGHGREGGVERADEIFVEPLGFFNLEADSRDRREVFLGEVDDEADAEVVQPCAGGQGQHSS